MLAHTEVRALRFVPELRLRLARDAIDLWEVTENAVGRGELPPPFWAFAWAGGLALAGHLLRFPEIVAGRNVVDVATGSGLVAIAAARAGAASVSAYDLDELAVSAVRLNARLNRVRLHAQQADVRGVKALPGTLVTAGDVFYDREIATAMLCGLGALRSAGAEVLVGDPHRLFLPVERLEPLASYDVDVEDDLENVPSKATMVARLLASPRLEAVEQHAAGHPV